MYTKEIVYEDYNGNIQKETYNFHLKKTELLSMEYSENPGESLQDKINKMTQTKDMPTLIGLIKTIILSSVGTVSEDGKKFIKTKEFRDEFEESEAFDTLFMELATDEKEATAFINGILPKDLREEANKQAQIMNAHNQITASPFAN